MAKTITAATLSPIIFYRSPVLAEHQLSVVEQQNFCIARRPVVYINVNGAPFQGLDTESPAGNGYYFPATLNAWQTYLWGDARISPDVQALRVSARCFFAAASGGEIRFTIGSASTTISVATADNSGRVVGSLLTSATGTGLRTVQIEMRTTLNAVAFAHWAQNLRVQSMVIAAANLPDPVDS